MIRARLIVREVLVVRIAIHHRMAVHAVRGIHHRAGPLGNVVEVAHPAAVCDYRVAIAIGIRTGRALFPRLAHGLHAHFRHEFAVFIRRSHFHAVVEGTLSLFQAGAIVRVRGVHQNFHGGDLRRALGQLFAHQILQTIAQHDDVTGEKNGLILAAIQHQRVHRNGIHHAFADAHVELARNVDRLCGRYISRRPSNLYLSHKETSLRCAAVHWRLALHRADHNALHKILLHKRIGQQNRPTANDNQGVF